MGEVDKVKSALTALGWDPVVIEPDRIIQPIYSLHGIDANGNAISGYSNTSWREAYNDAIGKSIAAGAAEDANIV